MIFHEMERRAHQIIDAIDSRMDPITPSVNDYVWQEIFEPEISAAVRDFEENAELHCYIKANVRSLIHDATSYVEDYADTLYWFYPTELWTTDHVRSLQSGREEFLRISTLPDKYKIALFQIDNELGLSGILPLKVVPTNDFGVFDVRWNDHIDWLMRIAPKTKGCPVRNVPSQFDQNRTMTEYFVDRFIETLGQKVVYSLFAGAAE